jgi:superfamily I DNA/RNA helicase
VVPCRSVRVAGRAPAFVAAGDEPALPAQVARATADLAGAYASVAVIVPAGLRAAVAAGLPAAATVLDPPDAKGLEFDAVVVVEPDLIAGGTARGLRLLYVALTRAVQELVVVHARPLPPALVPVAAA